MVSNTKQEDVELKLYKLNSNLKNSFSKVKSDIQKLAKTNEEHIDELNKKLIDFEDGYVEKQEFNNELDSFSKKYDKLRREIKKREKLKKELKEALKLREAVNSIAEDIKKINGIKREFKNFRDFVVSKEEFNMQANKFDARIKKRAQDINNMKKELDEMEKRFIDESYFNKQISDLRQEIQLVRKNSVENNYFRKNLNRLDSRFKRIINFLKKHPEIKKEDKKKIDEIEQSQGKEESALKSAWNGIVDFFTEEVEEPEKERTEKIKKKKEPKKEKKHDKGFWKAVVDFFTEDDSKEEWFEKREKQKKKEKKPKKALKKIDKKNKFIKYVFVLAGVLIIFFLYSSNFLTKIIGFIISYKYNILLGIIILAIIIFLSERREKK
ncbi:MAG: hypothetical protein KKF74_01900 [Nanoarchaeota archaeon]|nr:hypothetical protein [Nanoarchaeota archaeon]